MAEYTKICHYVSTWLTVSMRAVNVIIHGRTRNIVRLLLIFAYLYLHIRRNIYYITCILLYLIFHHYLVVLEIMIL